MQSNVPRTAARAATGLLMAAALGFATLAHAQTADQQAQQQAQQAQALGEVQDENPEVEMEEATKQDAAVSAKDVPEQIEEEDELERVSDEKSRDVVRKDVVAEEDEGEEGGDMSIETKVEGDVVEDDMAITTKP